MNLRILFLKVLLLGIVMFGLNTNVITAESTTFKQGKGVGNTIRQQFKDPVFAREFANRFTNGDLDYVIDQNLINYTIIVDFQNKGISSLDGIEVFTNIGYINVIGNNIEDFDAIGLDKLKVLNMDNNQLKTIKIENCKLLTTLQLNNNQLSSVNARNMPNLLNFVIKHNNLTSFDISGSTNLHYIDLQYNKLVSISIPDLLDLQELRLNDNQLTSLPSNFNKLEYLNTFTVGNNLLPDNFYNILNQLGLPNLTINIEQQDELMVNSNNEFIDIKNQTEYDNMDLLPKLKLKSGRILSSAHNLIITSITDINGNNVNVSDYVDGGNVKEYGSAYIQVRSTGTGLFPNNSDNAITDQGAKIKLNFLTTQYKAVFNLNEINNNTIYSTLDVYEGALITEPSNPVKNGYIFENWNTNKDGSGTTWDFATSKMPANDLILYAQWSPIKYGLSFDLNGGTGDAIDKQDVAFDTLATKPTTTPTKVGYTFDGWNTQANGSGDTWDFATSKMPANNVTLYAKWTTTKYELSFDLNGGTGDAIDKQDVAFDTLATKPTTTPTKVGYTFDGWNTQANGSGDTWDFAISKMPANNVTLYAKWSSIKYELSFDLNGGTGDAIDKQDVAFDTLATKPTTTPTKVGYTFDGWNTQANGSGDTWDFATSKMPANNVTLYAKWTTTKYELSFDLNGGTGDAIDKQDVAFDTLAPKPTTTPTKVGYTFDGWNTQANGSGDTWDFATSKMPANNVTLYAKWSSIKYELSFDLNGGTGDVIDKQDVSFDTLATKPTTTPTKVGYTFDGWNTQANGSGDTWDFAISKMPANNVTLYAKWSSIKYELSFDLNGGTGDAIDKQDVAFDTLATKPTTTPTKVGYTFDGWNTKANGSGDTWDFTTSKMPANKVTLYAKWSPIKYELSFDLNGGTGDAIDKQDVAFDTLATKPTTTPTKVGYTFDGWNTQANGNGDTWDFTTSKMPANNVILYAKWSSIKYELSFDLNGGTGDAIDKQDVAFDTLATKPTTTPTKVGYTFGGWNTQANGSGDTWDFATSKMPANNVILYAKWFEEEYTLEFDTNDGRYDVIPDQSLNYNEVSNAVTNPIKEGHTFISWNTKADGSGDTWDFTTSKMPSNNLTLYAQWTVNSYKLSFNLNGGTGNTIDQYVKYNNTSTAVSQPKKEGYIFIGWNTKEDGSGVSWNFVTSKMPANDLTLYANWKLNKYKVIYNANGGQGNMKNDEFTYNETKNLSTNLFTKEGYKFIGWSTKSDGKVEYTDKAKFKLLNNFDITLYAKWEKMNALPNTGIDVSIIMILLATSSLLSMALINRRYSQC